jgi:hypothetical protein
VNFGNHLGREVFLRLLSRTGRHFLIEQLAGDLLPNATQDQVAWTVVVRVLLNLDEMVTRE